MKIEGVEIDGVHFLPYHGEDDSTGYFRSFMWFCINNYFVQIIMNPELNNKFSLAPNDPMFGVAIRHGRVEGYNGLFFSTLNGNVRKVRIMYSIAKTLRIDLFVHTSE